MQAEMLVTGATVNLLAVEFYDELDTGGFVPHFLFEDPHVIAIERDDERIAELVAIAEQFLDMGEPDPLDMFLADYARADATGEGGKGRERRISEAHREGDRGTTQREVRRRPRLRHPGQGQDRDRDRLRRGQLQGEGTQDVGEVRHREGKDHEGATDHHPREGRERSCMSNHIEIHNPSTAVEMNVQERQHYASVLADANMIPKAFQKYPANIFVAIEYGNALGIAPHRRAQRDQRHQRNTVHCRLRIMSSLARSARPPGAHSEHSTTGPQCARSFAPTIPEFTHRSTWDQKKAKDSGLWGKGHWAKDPATMLRWRAISECVRMACPEVLGGLKYTPEETIELTGSPAPQRQAAPVQQQEDTTDFYALLEGCQSRDDLNAVAGKISAAGRMNEFRGTLNEFWKTLAPTEQQDEEVVDGTLIDEATGEIHDNAA